MQTQWKTYVTGLEKSTCKAEVRRMLKNGPPINLRDIKALPCPDDGETQLLWYASDQQEHSAKLTDSLLGEERERFWRHNEDFYALHIVDESEKEEEAKAATA